MDDDIGAWPVWRLAALLLFFGVCAGLIAAAIMPMSGNYPGLLFALPLVVLSAGMAGSMYAGGLAGISLAALGGIVSFAVLAHLPPSFALVGVEILFLTLLIRFGKPQATALPVAFLAFSSLSVALGQVVFWQAAGGSLPDELFVRPVLDTLMLCLLMLITGKAGRRGWSRWLWAGQRRFALLLFLSLAPLSVLTATVLNDPMLVGASAVGSWESMWRVIVMMVPVGWGLVVWVLGQALWGVDTPRPEREEQTWWAKVGDEAPRADAPNRSSWLSLCDRVNTRPDTSAFFASVFRRENGEWLLDSADGRTIGTGYQNEDPAVTGYAGEADVHPGDLAEHQRLLDSAARGEEVSGHIRLNLPGRGWRWFYALALPLHSESGELALLLHLDITSVKEAERQLVQSSKMSVLGEMAAGVAHEINQPLNVIRLATQNLRRRITSESVDTEYYLGKLDRIAAQTRRAADIIDHMRIFGRKPTDDPEYFSPVRSVCRVVDLLQSQLDGDGIRAVLDCETDGAISWGHESLFEQVMMNLLVNARDAINAREGAGDKEIFILCSLTADRELEIRVRDTGGGIPEAALDRLFQPFFTTKPSGKGTGLGLALSYGIIQDMNGDITARNVAGGAEFTVRMRVAEATVETSG